MGSYMKLVVLLAIVALARAELDAVEAIEPIEKEESLDPVAEESLDGEKEDKKRSATTTFCVEIRPSNPYQKPFQVCEPGYGGGYEAPKPAYNKPSYGKPSSGYGGDEVYVMPASPSYGSASSSSSGYNSGSSYASSKSEYTSKGSYGHAPSYAPTYHHHAAPVHKYHKTYDHGYGASAYRTIDMEDDDVFDELEGGNARMADARTGKSNLTTNFSKY